MMHLNTNLQDKDIPAGFDRKLCEKVGEVLKKPIEVSRRLLVKVKVGDSLVMLRYFVSL